MNITSKTIVTSIVLATIISQISCKKDIQPEIFSFEEKRTASIPANIFDWETATYMPTNPMNIVPVPWLGPVGGIDGNIAFDYKKSDGWELMYNTFSNQAVPFIGRTPPGGLYFALYNKFRGLIRFYLYIPEGTATPTSSLVHGLSLFPQGITSSPMLNYASQDIIDIDRNTGTIMQSNLQQLNLMGSWLVGQYEIAYDRNIRNTSFPSLGTQWSARTVNLTNFALNGTQVGSLTGTVSASSSTFNPGAIIQNTATGGLLVFGNSTVNAWAQSMPAGTPGRAFADRVGTVLSGLLGNNISGVINAVFGRTGATQNVNLRLSTQIRLDGSATNSVGITEPFFAIPGQQNATTANALIPAYNKAMGVFYITQKPQVRTSKGVYPVPGSGLPNDPRFAESRFFIGSSGQNDRANLIVFNPDVINESTATAEIIKQDLIVSPTGSTGSGGCLNMRVFGGQTEQINGLGLCAINPETVVCTSAYATLGFSWRYTIKVTPKNGANPVYHVKTFSVTENRI